MLFSDHLTSLFLYARKIGAAVAEHHDLTLNQLVAVQHLRKVERCTTSELGVRLDVTSGAVTCLVDKLEERRYVQRVPRVNDRRVIDLCLRPEGEALAEQLQTDWESHLEEWMGRLTPAERDQALMALRMLIAAAPMPLEAKSRA